MWFAGMTGFKTIYVFDVAHPRTLHANDFLELIPNAFEVGNGNVRSAVFLKTYEYVITVAPPKGHRPDETTISRTFYGFTGQTMQDAVERLVLSL